MFSQKLAHLLVGYSTDVQPGEVVGLTGSPRTEPLLKALYGEVLRAGGHPVVWMTTESCRDLLYKHGSAAQLAFANPVEHHLLTVADVLIQLQTIEGKPSTGPGELKRRLLHAQSRRPLREELLSRAARKELRWVVTPSSSPEAAACAGLSPTQYEHLLARAALLDRDDPAAAWRALSQRQARLIDSLSQASELRLVVPGGTDLRVIVAGRTWVNDDGHENLPDGEVFTAPREDGVDGTVCFDVPSLHAGGPVEGIRLVFRAGRVVDAAARRGEDALHALLAQDEGAHGVGEIALGCNYAIQRPTWHPLLDEKIGGTFHLALGAAHPATAGKNQSGLHWDLVCDLRRGGRVFADGRVISENGRFQRADWPQAR
jgi:aminopeptidase